MLATLVLLLLCAGGTVTLILFFVFSKKEKQPFPSLHTSSVSKVSIVLGAPFDMRFLFNSIVDIPLITAYRWGNSFFFSIISSLWFRLHLPFKYFWFNPAIKNYSGTLIVFDAMITAQYFTWLRQNNPKARIIFWYWNNFSTSDTRAMEAQLNHCEVWSYSKTDCEQHNFNYNTPFYVPEAYDNFVNMYSANNYTFDLAFFGRDKGRLEYLHQLMQEPALTNISWLIHVSPNHFYEKHKNRNYQKMLSYATMLQKQASCRAILDLVTQRSGGISLRCMESIYFKRKLVTTCTSVLNEPFFHPDNIFILEENNLSALNNFLQVPYHELEAEIVQYYSIYQWALRF